MANVNLGKVALTANGTWNNVNTYDKLDIVNYNGNSYIAKTSVPSGIAVTNEQYWQLLAEKGETGFSNEWGSIGGDIQDQEDLYEVLNNIEGMIASEFSTSTAYAIGDLVIYNDQYYRFKTAHPAGAWNASHVDQTTVSGEIISNVTDLKNSTNNITGNEAIPYNYKNYWFNTSGDTFDINGQIYSENFHSAVVDCVGGDIFTITASGGTSPRAWAFVDSNNNILSKAYSGEQCDDSIVTAPANAVKIVINNRIAGSDTAKPNAVSYKGELVRIQLAKVYGIDSDVETIENAVTEPLYTEETLSFVAATGYYDNVRIFNTYNNISTATINVSEGEKYYVISRNYGNMAIVCLLDSSNAVKSVYPSKGGDSPQTLQIEIPAGISKLMIQRAYNYYPTKLGLITGIRNKKPVSVLNGKHLTLIGDSITEKNFRASVNWPLYLREWCGAVIQNLGVGGSGFYNGSNRYSDRIQSIQNPDIIGVALSFNDLADETFPIGTASDTGTSSLAGYANSFFDTLIASYPTIPIIAYIQSPWGAYKPGNSRSDEWIDVFTQICQLKGVPFYSEMYYGSALKPWLSANRAVYYVSDGEESASQTDDVHPNSEGHKIIARHLYPHFAENLVTTGLDYQ